MYMVVQKVKTSNELNVDFRTCDAQHFDSLTLAIFWLLEMSTLEFLWVRVLYTIHTVHLYNT